MPLPRDRANARGAAAAMPRKPRRDVEWRDIIVPRRYHIVRYDSAWAGAARSCGTNQHLTSITTPVLSRVTSPKRAHKRAEAAVLSVPGEVLFRSAVRPNAPERGRARERHRGVRSVSRIARQSI